MRTLNIGSHTVPIIGQGTWRMGEDPSLRSREVAALQLGIELGMTLIDTAEMYGEGGAEKIVGAAIAGRRDQVYLVSKVYPHNASRKGTARACEASLRRLGTEHIDLYLLHWRGQYPLAETVEALERLQDEGKIGRWGVSNFDVDDLEELAAEQCATNQVLYNPQARDIEFDLLPWCAQNRLPVMAYCPIAQGGGVLKHPALLAIAQRHGVTPAQACLAWVLRQPGLIAIPKATAAQHVRLNAAAATLELTPQDLQEMDAAFPPPLRKRPLSMV
jgi:diketogulonate reductase-like aldo/keto reductase